MLQALTQHKKDKINHAIKTMGTPDSLPTVLDGIQRNIVRGFINGLGFESQSYIGLNYQELTNVYRFFSVHPTYDTIESINALCRSAGANGDSEVAQWRTQAINHYQQATNNYTNISPVTTTATPAIDSLDVSLPVETPVNAKADSGSSLSKEQTQAIAAIMAILDKPKTPVFDESKMIELIKKHATATRIEIVKDSVVVKTIEGLSHKALADLVKMASTKENVLMVGPAGSGKTTLAHQVAESLGLDYYFNGALSSEYKLSGFIDAQGRVVSTAFKKAYENGGVYLFDEVDVSTNDALLAFNAALSNGHADFPEGMIARHPDFICLAAANTFGRGADRIYVGRNQLDGAFLDRFMTIDIDYDETIERTLAGNDNWTDYVQAIRKAVFDLKIRHVVSPRASIKGAKLLASGLSEKFVQNSVIWKGLDRDSRNKIEAKAGV